MFAQLGNTLFDGLKSFVAYSNEEEAILVEHALINRKPRLQGAGLGLRQLTLSLFLHQEFCVVKDEISKLRTSKDSFEVLPLLWGNGQLEGEFVISSMSINNTLMDGLGNAYAVVISVTLKESVVDNKIDQQEQKSREDAFAVGDKKPATKSTRVNPTPCNSFVAKETSTIQSNGAMVADLLKGYKVGNTNNTKAITHLGNIKTEVDKLKNAIADPDYPCIYSNANALTASDNLNTAVKTLANTLALYESTPLLANATTVNVYNTSVQSKIAILKTSLSSNLKSAALRK